jgi:hypothetical protein
MKETCVECEKGDWVGATCDRIGLRLDTVTLKPGYWRTSSASDEIFSCEDEHVCVGGNATESLCAQGHWGPWCANCFEGYYSPDEGECESCTGEEKQTMIIVSGAVFLVLLMITALSRYVWFRWSSGDEEDPTWRPEDHPDVIHRSSVLKLILIFAQAIASLQEVFDMAFPLPLTKLLKSAMCSRSILHL